MAYQEHYTQQLLDNLRAKLLIMGSKTQQALDDAAIAVLNHDLPRAAAVLDGDTDIDDLENQIDEATLNILARTQPVARDLRFLMSVVRMVLDLERIGDESVVVAEQVTLSDKPIPSIVEKDLRALCTRTSAMLRNSLLAFQNGDAPSALAVSRYDDETAQMMVNIFQKLMQAVGDRLICTYSRGSGHSIDEGARDAYARTSTDGGRTWTPEVCFARDPRVGEVMIGKGLDRDGAALFWVRCMGRPKSHHDLYRTVDGVAFEKIAEPSLEPFPMQITDIFHADGKLMALWFATRYREDDEQSWGTLVSADNGRTWTQRTVETVMKKSELPTEPCVVNLGGGRLLGLARTENGGDSSASQFQLTSCDNGATWKKTRTNIRDICASSPSLVYDAGTGLVYNYYYERGRRVVKRRVARADDVFDHPLDWPAPEALLRGDEARPWDAGNVNAVAMGGKHFLTYYSGNETNTTVYVAPAPLAE